MYNLLAQCNMYLQEKFLSTQTICGYLNDLKTT